MTKILIRLVNNSGSLISGSGADKPLFEDQRKESHFIQLLSPFNCCHY